MNFKTKFDNFNDKLVYLFVILGSVLGIFLFVRSCIGGHPSKGYFIMTLLCFLCVFYYSKKYLKSKELNDIFDDEELDLLEDDDEEEEEEESDD